ncbi:SPOR domain-containing protein [Candidatus Dependentiae bacterium]|nr:SPOR domain-containing protein [Candidatus Dependentiae bacterium]
MSDQNGIHITKKQASITAALLIFLSILIFIAGYFWGKQSMLEEFTQKTSQESFNDQVDYLLTMQSFTAKHGPLPENEQEKEKQLENIPDALEENEKEKEEDGTKQPEYLALNGNKKNVTEVKSLAIVDSAEKNEKHFATLAGFGKKNSAEAMIQRLKKYKIDLELKTKISKSASGRGTRTWYQVVTKTYPDKDEVQRIVDRVVALEHIKRTDVKIF